MKINSNLKLNIDDTFGNFGSVQKNREDDKLNKQTSLDSAKHNNIDKINIQTINETG